MGRFRARASSAKTSVCGNLTNYSPSNVASSSRPNTNAAKGDRKAGNKKILSTHVKIIDIKLQGSYSDRGAHITLGELRTHSFCCPCSSVSGFGGPRNSPATANQRPSQPNKTPHVAANLAAPMRTLVNPICTECLVPGGIIATF